MQKILRTFVIKLKYGKSWKRLNIKSIKGDLKNVLDHIFLYLCSDAEISGIYYYYFKLVYLVVLFYDYWQQIYK